MLSRDVTPLECLVNSLMRMSGEQKSAMLHKKGVCMFDSDDVLSPSIKTLVSRIVNTNFRKTGRMTMGQLLNVRLTAE